MIDNRFLGANRRVLEARKDFVQRAEALSSPDFSVLHLRLGKFTTIPAPDSNG